MAHIRRPTDPFDPIFKKELEAIIGRFFVNVFRFQWFLLDFTMALIVASICYVTALAYGIFNLGDRVLCVFLKRICCSFFKRMIENFYGKKSNRSRSTKGQSMDLFMARRTWIRRLLL